MNVIETSTDLCYSSRNKLYEVTRKLTEIKKACDIVSPILGLTLEQILKELESVDENYMNSHIMLREYIESLNTTKNTVSE